MREIVRAARALLEGNYSGVWVEGEIGSLRVHHSSGHRYFELREPGCVLPAVMWRSVAAAARAVLEDGKRFRCLGSLTIWEGGGKFQIVVQRLEEAGAGDIAARIEALKRKLQAEGLTAPERKRPLPWIPRGVGVVTSVSGAAVRDVLKVLSRRVPVEVVVAHCAVQGDHAPASIIGALGRVAARPGIDVVIVTRGGGSAQDLMAYNDEAVARAVAACPVPVVTAVGHEVDVTVVDLLSDLRAATPSEAAERVAPTVADVTDRLRWARDRSLRAVRTRMTAEGRALALLRAKLPSTDEMLGPPRQMLDDAMDRSHHAVAGAVERRRRRTETLGRRLAAAHPRWRLARQRGIIEGAAARLVRWPAVALAARRIALDAAGGRLHRWAPAALAAHRERLAAREARLSALSPLGVLGRGYAIARDADGAILTDADRVSAGQRIDVTLARGGLDCEVRSIRGDK